ncbi:MAG: hypothetical protein WBO49_01305 [Candidatus Saccharimonas sp.]
MDRKSALSSTEGHRFHTPENLSGGFLKFDTRDWWWTGTMVVATLLVSQLHLWYFLAGFVLTYVSLLRTSNARLYEVMLRTTHRFTVRRFHGGRVVAEDNKKSLRQLPYDEIVTITDPKTEREVINLLKLGGGAYGVLIVGDGAVTPTLDKWSRSIRTAVLGRQLRQMMRLGVSWVMQLRPWNPYPFSRFKASAMHDRAWAPKSPIDPDTEEDAKLAQYGKFLQEVMLAKERAVQQRGREVVMAVPLVMAGNDDLDRAGNAIEEVVLKRSPIVRRAMQVVKYLRRYGVIHPRIATEQEMVAYLRQTWDAAGLAGKNGYYKRTNDGTAGRVKFKDYLPRKVSYHPGCLEVDGNFVAFVRTRKLPPSVEPGWLDNVFSVLDDDGDPINMSTATIGSVVNKKSEVRSLRMFIPFRKLIESRILSNQFRSTDNIESHRLALERERELSINQKTMQEFLFLQVVFAASLEDLEYYLECVTNVLEGKDLEPYRVIDPDSMWDCLWASNGFGQM